MDKNIITNEIKKLYDPERTVIIGIDGLGGAGKALFQMR